MQSVKGIYKSGKIDLLEKVEAKNPCKVIITFIDEEDLSVLREYQDEEAFSFWRESDQDIYQDYLKKKV